MSHVSVSHIWTCHDSHTCVVTLLYVWHDPFICVTWPIHMFTLSIELKAGAVLTTTDIYIYMYMYMYMYMYIYDANICRCWFDVCTCAWMRVCVYIHIYVYIHVCVCGYVYTYLYICTYAYIYIYSRVSGSRNHGFWPSQRVSKHTLMKSETQPASVVSINH